MAATFPMIQLFQIVCGLCWLVPVILYLPALRRVLCTDDWQGIDAPRAVVWFTGAVQMFGVGRWLAWSESTKIMGQAELTTWAGVYVAHSLCALSLVYVLHARAEAKRP